MLAVVANEEKSATSHEPNNCGAILCSHAALTSAVMALRRMFSDDIEIEARFNNVGNWNPTIPFTASSDLRSGF